MKWLPFPCECVAVNGLPFWQEDGVLRRLPARLKDKVPPAVWALSQHTSGGRLRFISDTTALAIRARFDHLAHMNNMPRSGQLGLDLWIEGEYWRPLFPTTNTADFCEAFFVQIPRQRREYCIYLGLYGPIEIMALGVDEEALIEPPSPFALDKPIVFYGSSITQGGCATRAGMSYPAIVCRRLNLDFVNLGFSGAGRGEPSVAEAIAEIEAACYVMDWAQNCPTLEEFASRYGPFLDILRRAHPHTPIICITPIFSLTELWGGNDKFAAMRDFIRQEVAWRQKAGDRHIYIVEGFSLLGPDDREGLVDASHPNDWGFMKMAQGLEPVLRDVLQLAKM